MKSLMLIISAIILITGCSKSSSSNSVAAPPPCTTDSCKLVSYKWEIVSQTVQTDMGKYTYTTSQLATINWATFLFKPDLTYRSYGGQTGNYTYTTATKKMVLFDALLPISFDVAFPTLTSVTFTGDKVQMNPRTDSSIAANFEINAIAGGLYTDFGVDTSKIHFIQTVFSYNGY